MKTIPLTQGQVALVDDEDYEEVSKFKWHANGCNARTKTFYAYRSICVNGKRTTIKMHRQILKLPSGAVPQVDHIDGNGLNNQRNNLRTCTETQNRGNVRLTIANTSGFKGVRWFKPSKKWVSRIIVNKKYTHLGYFNHAIDAALAYDDAASKHFGEFALLNIEIMNEEQEREICTNIEYIG